MRLVDAAVHIFKYRVPAHHWPHLHEWFHRVDGFSAGAVLYDQEAVRTEDGGDREEDEGAGPGGSPGRPGPGRVGDGPRQRGDEQEARRGGLWNGLRRGALLRGQSVGEQSGRYFNNREERRDSGQKIYILSSCTFIHCTLLNNSLKSTITKRQCRNKQKLG